MRRYEAHVFVQVFHLARQLVTQFSNFWLDEGFFFPVLALPAVITLMTGMERERERGKERSRLADG